MDEQWWEGRVRIPSGCAIASIIDSSGQRFSGEAIVTCMALMHERSNGLGGGFAAYGIYPERADEYALHLMLMKDGAQEAVESLIAREWRIEDKEPLPVRPVKVLEDPPRLLRYFLRPAIKRSESEEREKMALMTMEINYRIDGAFVGSCGKNMGVFKGVGYPEDIAEFYRLDEYRAHMWSGHGRFPTNTPGWWGGAHPFALLDLTVVHNGEISSYGANKRYLESHGYRLTLQTDTEVMAYAIDMLHRRHGVSMERVAQVLAPPHWREIDLMEDQRQAEVYRALRRVYGSLLMNGPFSIIAGHSAGMMALNDRLKLRSLVAAQADVRTYVASEEAAIRAVCPNPSRVWSLGGSEPLIVHLGEGRACRAA